MGNVISPCFCRVSVEALARESLGEFKKAVRKTRAYRLVFPQHFLFSQTSTSFSVTRLKHDTLKSINLGVEHLTFESTE